ncbi:TRAPP II complex [Polychytrium aggregatum]|uniref:TRAPP II complex n=1 Tax=Polychytrium aggregatum TaxID=110093 RepID=UPI0022FF0EFA|nr:TRAPP II complex [Polychytrium aggregatum]KAI9193335.1 TRAPP II complex [Polychytrium aggregatum]
MESLGICELARIRILLVPVGRLKRDTFFQYVDLVSKFAVVSVSDLSPPAHPPNHTNRFFDNIDPRAQIYFNFVTSYEKDHAALEDFQLHRQIMGVIGIMHCQETVDIKQSYQAFQRMLARYPTHLVSRCFAFEPAENQDDDTRGLIMIPNVGQLSFYLTTMINDFSSELLVSLGGLADRLEKRSLIPGPAFSPAQATIPLPQPTGGGGSSGGGGGISGGSGGSTLLAPQTPTLQPAGSPAVSISDSETGGSGFSNLGGLFQSMDRGRKKTNGRVAKLMSDLFLLAGRHELAMQSYTSAIDIAKNTADYTWQAAAIEGYLCATLVMFMRKIVSEEGSNRSSAAGSPLATPHLGPNGTLRPPLTLKAAMTTDSLFETAANHQHVRQLLAEIPDRYREIVNLYEKASQPGAPGYYPLLQISACLKVAYFLTAMCRNQFQGTVPNGAGVSLTYEGKGVAEAGGSRVGLQNAMMMPGAANPSDRIVLNGGVGASRVDVSTWLMRAWDLGLEYLTVADQIHSVATMAAVYSLLGYKRKHAFFLRQTALLISSTFKSDSQTSLAAARKIVEPYSSSNILLVDNLEAAEASSFNLSASSNNLTTGRPDTAAAAANVPAQSNSAIECMKKVCHVFGVGAKTIESLRSRHAKEPGACPDEDEDDWFDEYDQDVDVESTLGNTAIEFKKKISVPRLRFGWPHLQIDVLKECISISETVDDCSSTILYTTRLLRRLHSYLSMDEQKKLSATLQSVVLRTRARSISKGTMVPSAVAPSVAPVLVKGIMGSVTGVPVLRKLSAVLQTPRRIPYPHKPKKDAQQDRANPFIYNPGAEKDNAKKKSAVVVVLVAGEAAYFDVVLANPFSFELDIQSITLKTSGVNFVPNSVATTLQPMSRLHTIRLSGVPTTNGMLHVHGCTVRMLGGCVEEDITPVSKVLNDLSKRNKDGTRRKQDDRERLGSKAGALIVTRQKSVETMNSSKWPIPFKVIPEQPMLQVDEASLRGLEALLLFEGERSTFSIQVQNIGSTPINNLVVSFSETYEPLSNEPAAEYAEDIYERDVHDRSICVFWIADTEETLRKSMVVHQNRSKVRDSLSKAIDLFLNPGESKTIRIGMYGKAGCTGGSISLQYGYIAEHESSLTHDAENDGYTRRLVLPILLTVEKALQPINVDFIPSSSIDYFTSISQPQSKPGDLTRLSSIDDMMVVLRSIENTLPSSNISTMNDYFLLTMDVRNSMNRSFDLTFEIFDDAQSDISVDSCSATIHAGVTKRIVIPIRRFTLPESDVAQAIPAPQWKQFVLGKIVKVSDRENADRKAIFWYKEALVGGLAKRGIVVARWTCSKNRSGLFSLRSLKITPTMFEVIKQQRLSFSIKITSLTSDGRVLEMAPGMDTAHFEVQLNEVLEFEWSIQNCSDTDMDMLFRFQPVQDSLGAGTEDDISGKVLIHGTNQLSLGSLKARERQHIRVPMIFIATGGYRIIYHCEELQGDNNRFWGPLINVRVRE